MSLDSVDDAPEAPLVSEDRVNRVALAFRRVFALTCLRQFVTVAAWMLRPHTATTAAVFLAITILVALAMALRVDDLSRRLGMKRRWPLVTLAALPCLYWLALVFLTWRTVAWARRRGVQGLFRRALQVVG